MQTENIRESKLVHLLPCYARSTIPETCMRVRDSRWAHSRTAAQLHKDWYPSRPQHDIKHCTKMKREMKPQKAAGSCNQLVTWRQRDACRADSKRAGGKCATHVLQNGDRTVEEKRIASSPAFKGSSLDFQNMDGSILGSWTSNWIAGLVYLWSKNFSGRKREGVERKNLGR